MLTIKRLSLALAVTALVAGCSSGVKLDDKPVDGSLSSRGANGGQGQSGVSGVDLTGSAAKAGPQGVSRIVYFDFDSYSVKADAQPQIEAHAKFIKANPAAKVSWKAYRRARRP
jgi:peptidoglycan-associated lipoprotein